MDITIEKYINLKEQYDKLLIQYKTQKTLAEDCQMKLTKYQFEFDRQEEAIRNLKAVIRGIKNE